MNYKRYKNLLLLLLIVIVFNGCIGGFLNLHQHNVWELTEYSKVLPPHDNNLTVKLDKSSISTKIYIDNSIDLIRREAFMDELYKELLKKDAIELWRNHYQVEKNNNYINANKTYLKLDSQFTYDFEHTCFLDCPKKVIDVTKWEKVDDGVTLYTKIDPNFIISLYSSIPSIGYPYDIDVPYRLDTTSMDNGIAHFTDDYLRRFSLKELLTKELSDKGFIVVNNQQEADIVIVIENITFSGIKSLVSNIPYPKTANLELNELSTLQNKPYYTFPVKVVSFRDLFNTNIKVNTGVGYVHPSGTGLAVGVLASLAGKEKGGAISTVNYLTVYYKNRRLGSIIDLAIANKKNQFVTIKDYIGKPQKVDYSEIISDELIDELNTQAAKQVLEKIRFVEK